MSTVEIENGVGRGGTVNGLAMFEAPGLAGIDLKLAAADIRSTCALLSCFERAYFSSTEKNYVFKDAHFAMSIRKATATFPEVKRIVEAASGETLSVPAGQLADALLDGANKSGRRLSIPINAKTGTALSSFFSVG